MTDKRIEDQLMDLAQRLFLQENRLYTVSQLVPRFRQVANQRRQDLTIQQVARVLEAMAVKAPLKELTAQDLQTLGKKFWSHGTEFSEEFRDLLDPETAMTTPVKASSSRHDYHGNLRNASDVKDTVTEVDLYNEETEIEQLVDPNLTYAKRDLPLFRYAAVLVEEELRATSRIAKTALRLKYQTPEVLLYQASFKTAAGEAEVFVPVELKDGNPLIPQVMTANDKIYSLDTAGVDTLTEDLTYATYAHQAEAAKRLRADLGLYNHNLRSDSMNEIEVDELDDLPQKQVKLEVAEIEGILKDAVFRKDSSFDETTIAYGRDLVAIELHDLGYKNPQVRFAGDWNKGLLYKAAVHGEGGKIEIDVPVETARGMLLNPHCFAYKNQMHDLSRQAISKLFAEGESTVDVHPLLFSMSYPDLKKQLRRAAHQHSPKLAQSVIELIGEKFGEYYKTSSIDDYQTWLEEATESYKARCGDCNYYTPKAASAVDNCNLIKTACKNVRKDAESGICTRSIFTEDQPESILFDTGLNIKL